MKIINRYIFTESLLFFAISLFSFTSILLTLRMLRFASLIVNKGVGAAQIAEVFISIIPTFLEIAIPMSTLLGVMMAFARLSGDSEIVVMRASGISIYQLVTPVVFIGVLSAAISSYVSIELKPWGFRNLSNVFFEIARSKSTSGLTEGVFNPLGNLTLYAERIDDRSGELARVLIDDRRDKQTRRVIVAKTGLIVSDALNRTITLQLFDGESHEIVQQRYVTTHFVDNSLTMQSDELFDASSQKKDRSPREMAIGELRSEIAQVKSILQTVQDGPSAEAASPPPASISVGGTTAAPPPTPSRSELRKRSHRLRTELGSRFSMPLASFVLALIALPLGIMPPRTQKTWGAGLSLTIGLAVFVAYYGFLSVGLTLGEAGRINTYLALWLPNVLCAVTAIFFIQRIGSERWISVAEALSAPLSRIGALFRLRSWRRSKR